MNISRWLLGKQTERRGPCLRHLAVGVSYQGNPVATGIATHVSSALTAVADERTKRMKRMRHPCFEGPEQVGRDKAISYMVCVRPDDPTVETTVGHGVRDEDVALQVGVDVAEVLAALHSMDIAHGQVSPQSIHVHQREDLVHGVLADPAAVLWPGAPHIAPEVRKGRCPDLRSDLYGLGRALDLLAPEECGEDLRELVDHLLAEDPAERPESAGMVLQRLTSLRDQRQPTGWAKLLTLFAG